ncbi:MAG: glycerol-3-phosphate 1-O-acyltransferase PlsY [Verrucomicrobia bacterium]|nr:MAG: glycerol-3-phosphate 1-O-acyltransferase PlsY [Verrucomicrobiota bacterium]
MNFFVPLVIIALGAYLIGSLPAGYLAGLCCGIDIRLHGSGNIGATNVMRVLNKKWGYSVFAVDFLKGWFPVFLAMLWSNNASISPHSAPGAIAALAALLGHNFPIWLHFRGGKGISTSAGIIVGMFPGSFLFCLGSWGLVFMTTRYVSIASIVASIMLPTTVILFYLCGHFFPNWPLWLTGDWLSVVVSLLMGGLALWRHRGNMKRLLAGTEPRFESKKPKK